MNKLIRENQTQGNNSAPIRVLSTLGTSPDGNGMTPSGAFSSDGFLAEASDRNDGTAVERQSHRRHSSVSRRSIWEWAGDIVGGVCLFGTLFLLLIIAGAYQ